MLHGRLETTVAPAKPCLAGRADVYGSAELPRPEPNLWCPPVRAVESETGAGDARGTSPAGSWDRSEGGYFAESPVRIPSAAGIHVTGLLRPEIGRSDAEIVRLALRRGVDVSLPVSALAVTGPPRRGLVIGYGAVPTDRIPEGLRRLRECVS